MKALKPKISLGQAAPSDVLNTVQFTSDSGVAQDGGIELLVKSPAGDYVSARIGDKTGTYDPDNEVILAFYDWDGTELKYEVLNKQATAEQIQFVLEQIQNELYYGYEFGMMLPQDNSIDTYHDDSSYPLTNKIDYNFAGWKMITEPPGNEITSYDDIESFKNLKWNQILDHAPAIKLQACYVLQGIVGNGIETYNLDLVNVEILGPTAASSYIRLYFTIDRIPRSGDYVSKRSTNPILLYDLLYENSSIGRFYVDLENTDHTSAVIELCKKMPIDTIKFSTANRTDGSMLTQLGVSSINIIRLNNLFYSAGMDYTTSYITYAAIMHLNRWGRKMANMILSNLYTTFPIYIQLNSYLLTTELNLTYTNFSQCRNQIILATYGMPTDYILTPEDFQEAINWTFDAVEIPAVVINGVSDTAVNARQTMITLLNYIDSARSKKGSDFETLEQLRIAINSAGESWQ